MTNINKEVYKNKPALPNKLLQVDGSITDLAGNAVIGAVDAYESKSALPNKWLNPDGTYSTLAEIVAGMIDMELFIVVEELPATGEPNKIYLLVQGDKLIEYIWVNDKWDPIGMVEFDINNYYTKDQVTQLISAALDSAKSYADNKASVAETNANTYTDTKLVDYVKNTDYAAESKAGLIRIANSLAINSNGFLRVLNRTYATYQTMQDIEFISKGTLENVITGKELVNKTYVDNIVGDIESILEELDVGGGVQ